MLSKACMLADDGSSIGARMRKQCLCEGFMTAHGTLLGVPFPWLT